MQQFYVETIMNRLKSTYKAYSGEKKDKSVSLKEVAEFFNIVIDESRLEDYVIKCINLETPSITLFDNKTETTYISEYTCDAKLFSCYGGNVKYNSLLTITPTHRIDSLYYIGDKKPLFEQMTFKDGDYYLVFEREFPNNLGINVNDYTNFNLRYIEPSNYDCRIIQQRLLNKIYREKHVGEEKIDTFDQLYTYGPGYLGERNDSQDKYTYLNNNNVIYGIGDFSLKENHINLKGICFKNTKVKTKNYFPSAWCGFSYPILEDENTNSAMLFRGNTKNYWHLLDIYKIDNNAYIKYILKEISLNSNIILNQELNVPLLCDGDISSEELRIISTTLQDQYINDEFINLVLSELGLFGKKIETKNGAILEEDILSPKLFINKSFDVISDLVNNNKDEFFKLIREQFESTTHINVEKGYARSLKPNNNQNN